MKRCCDKSSRNLRPKDIEDLTDSSDSRDIDDPICIMKIDHMEHRVMRKYDKNKDALKRWALIRMKLLSHLTFMHALRIKRQGSLHT